MSGWMFAACFVTWVVITGYLKHRYAKASDRSGRASYIDALLGSQWTRDDEGSVRWLVVLWFFLPGVLVATSFWRE